MGEFLNGLVEEPANGTDGAVGDGGDFGVGKVLLQSKKEHLSFGFGERSEGGVKFFPPGVLRIGVGGWRGGRRGFPRGLFMEFSASFFSA